MDNNLHQIDQELKVFLFQAVRKLTINIVKHAQAALVSVVIRSLERKITITVQDDGIGFDTGAPSARPGTGGGFGLFSLRERLDLYSDRMRMDSDNDTTVTLEVPEQVEQREAQ